MEKSMLPSSRRTSSFLSGAEESGEVAVALGETLDKCADAIDSILDEIDKIQNPDIKDNDDDDKNCNDGISISSSLYTTTDDEPENEVYTTKYEQGFLEGNEEKRIELKENRTGNDMDNTSTHTKRESPTDQQQKKKVPSVLVNTENASSVKQARDDQEGRKKQSRLEHKARVKLLLDAKLQESERKELFFSSLSLKLSEKDSDREHAVGEHDRVETYFERYFTEYEDETTIDILDKQNDDDEAEGGSEVQEQAKMESFFTSLSSKMTNDQRNEQAIGEHDRVETYFERYFSEYEDETTIDISDKQNDDDEAEGDQS